MMAWTDRHFRAFARCITRDAVLYTEMVTTGALLHGDHRRFLAHSPAEYPVAYQLGGSDPDDMARAAAMAAAAGFQEINMNVGCPSDRVQSGRFGACLMTEPARVADCVRAMREAVTVPVTVKSRIGVDDHDSYELLLEFIDTIAAAGCDRFVVHARKAWLTGLSPKQNREVPPLRHDVVLRLKHDRPALAVELNGGLANAEAIRDAFTRFDGAMIGRAAYHDPYLLDAVDPMVSGMAPASVDRHAAVLGYLPYVERELSLGVPLGRLIRPLLGLFQGRPGARVWRRRLSEQAHRAGAGVDVVSGALAAVPRPDVERARTPPRIAATG